MGSGCPKCFFFWSLVAGIAFLMLAVNWFRVMGDSQNG